jgi:hypothetical protein
MRFFLGCVVGNVSALIVSLQWLRQQAEPDDECCKLEHRYP